ncbi:MAG TPA: TolC family protein [Panacibacter sp.]|nr:TolC family protein [Panacibacter sp.]
MRYKKQIVYKLVFIPLLLLLLQTQAQEVKTITLNEAIGLSIKNSKQLKLSKARIDEAIAATKEATERKLPDASISGSYLRIAKPTINYKTGGGSSDTSGGGGGTAATPTINQALYGMANLSLPLYSGLKIRYGIESAKYLEQATMLDADNDKQGIILNTIAAYINLFKANAATKLVEENLEQSRKRDTDFSNLEKNGLLARNDLLKAQLQTSNIELALLDAQNSIQLATVNMNLMLGLPETTKLLPDSASIQQAGELKTIEEYEQLAAQNRNDVKALGYREKAADAAVKAAKGNYYPSIALTGGYVAADIPSFLTVTNALNIGIGVKYSLSSLWKTKSKIEQAQAQQQQLQASGDMLTDEIHLSINKAYQGYASGLKKIEVYNKAVEQATENYRISKNKYDNSLLLLTDLLDADVAQLQAKLNLTLAKADVVLSYQTLLQKAGMLNQ